MITTSEIAQKIIEISAKAGWQKLNRNYKRYKLQKFLGIGEAENTFDSIYIHTLIEYAAETTIPEMVFLFTDERVKKAFHKSLIEKKEKEFLEAVEQTLDKNGRFGYLRRYGVFKSAAELKQQIDLFKDCFSYLTGQSASPFHLKKYNEDRRFQQEILAEKESKVERRGFVSKSSIDFGYITRIELENIRSFKSLSINLQNNKTPRLLSVIIGRNGTCKSTLLRCIALALCYADDAGALLADFGGQLVSENATSGSIVLGMADTHGKDMSDIRVEIVRKGDRDVIMSSGVDVVKKNFFVCGYGSDRGIVGKSDRVRSYRAFDSVGTLFDYDRSLVNIELMLRRLADHLGSEKYKRAMKGIKHILGLGTKQKIYYAKGGGVKVSGPGIGREIPIDGWADGYRMTFNWLIDLYGWAILADAVTETGGIRGILLIDEIDRNLHPAMQKIVLNEIKKALPELQVFATTHSPITALGTQSENIIALHRKGERVRRAVVPSLVGYSTDDMLVEESLFGVDPYPEYTRKKLDRHRKLVSIPKSKRTKKQSQEMYQLTSELDPAKLPGLRDDPIVKKLDKIEELLKKESQS